MPDELDELFSVAPEDFVATRNRLVKAWRGAGRRDDAKELATLRRPSVADWALNVVSHEHAADVTALLDAAQQLRAIQADAIEGRGGDLRSALTELRAASTTVHRRADDVLTRAGRDRGAQAAAISTRLNEVAANGVVADQLGAGRLGSAPVDDADPFSGLYDSPLAPPRADKAPKPEKPGRPDRATKRSGAEPKEDPEAKRRAAAERRQRRDALATARRAKAAAASALAKADTALAAARDTVVAAEHRRDDAQAELDAAGAAEAEAETAMARHDDSRI